MEISEKYARLRFSQLPGYKFSNFLEIIDTFDSIDNFLNGNSDFITPRKSQSESLKVVDAITPEQFVVYGEDDYPKLLADTPYPPIALFYKGEMCIRDRNNE